MSNSELINQFMDNAMATHAKSSPAKEISKKILAIELSLTSGALFSMGRGARVCNSLSTVPMKKFLATHPLVPPVL